MHFTTLVLVPAGTEDIVEAVTRQMEPYNSEQMVLPRKEAVPAHTVQSLVKVDGLAADDLEALARQLHEDSGFECWVEDGTIYWMTTDNPRAYWDGWTLLSLTENVWAAPEVPRDVIPVAIVTPDGAWQWLDDDVDYTPEMREASTGVIRQRTRAVLENYPAYLAVALDCHA